MNVASIEWQIEVKPAIEFSDDHRGHDRGHSKLNLIVSVTSFNGETIVLPQQMWIQDWPRKDSCQSQEHCKGYLIKL